MPDNQDKNKNYFNDVLKCFQKAGNRYRAITAAEIAEQLGVPGEPLIYRSCQLLVAQNILGKKDQTGYSLRREILPCACGHDASIEKKRYPNTGFTINCNRDGCKAIVKRSRADDAIDAWNTMSYVSRCG